MYTYLKSLEQFYFVSYSAEIPVPNSNELQVLTW